MRHHHHIHKAHPTKPKQLFTLVELVLVLIIIGFVLRLSFHSVKNQLPAIKLEAAAKKLSIDLEYAKNLALSTSSWSGVFFEVEPANKYRFIKADKNGAGPIENPGAPGQDFVVNLYDFYKGVAVQAAGPSEVWFDPLGVPYVELHGSLLSQTAVVTLEYQSVIKMISISPNTGRIKVI